MVAIETAYLIATVASLIIGLIDQAGGSLTSAKKANKASNYRDELSKIRAKAVTAKNTELDSYIDQLNGIANDLKSQLFSLDPRVAGRIQSQLQQINAAKGTIDNQKTKVSKLGEDIDNAINSSNDGITQSLAADLVTSGVDSHSGDNLYQDAMAYARTKGQQGSDSYRKAMDEYKDRYKDSAKKWGYTKGKAKQDIEQAGETLSGKIDTEIGDIKKQFNLK